MTTTLQRRPAATWSRPRERRELALPRRGSVVRPELFGGPSASAPLRSLAVEDRFYLAAGAVGALAVRSSRPIRTIGVVAPAGQAVLVRERVRDRSSVDHVTTAPNTRAGELMLASPPRPCASGQRRRLILRHASRLARSRRSRSSPPRASRPRQRQDVARAAERPPAADHRAVDRRDQPFAASGRAGVAVARSPPSSVARPHQLRRVPDPLAA